jgi:hypothetical protein
MTACSMIDTASFNRLRAFFDDLATDDRLRVKIEYLVFELVEKKLIGALDGENVVSEANKSFSRTYESNQGKAENVIRDYLLGENDHNGIPLLYAGNL